MHILFQHKNNKNITLEFFSNKLYSFYLYKFQFEMLKMINSLNLQCFISRWQQN